MFQVSERGVVASGVTRDGARHESPRAAGRSQGVGACFVSFKELTEGGRLGCLQGLLDRWFIGSVANGKLTKHGQTPFAQSLFQSSS